MTPEQAREALMATAPEPGRDQMLIAAQFGPGAVKAQNERLATEQEQGRKPAA